MNEMLNPRHSMFSVALRLSVILSVAAFLFVSQNAFFCPAQNDAAVGDEIAPVDAPFPMPQFHRPLFPARVLDIRAFGAVEGGTAKNTQAIQATIDSTAKLGGGTVLVPAGKWLTGALHLESNINLHLEAGAELLFSQELDDYLPVVFARHEDTECYKPSSFIYANGKRNIAITGEGVLNGQGKPWWDLKTKGASTEKRLHAMGASSVPVDQRIFDGQHEGVLRPAFFQPMNCTNVFVEGVTFLYGAFWTITPTYCDTVVVRKVHIVTEGEYGHTPNGDGVDPSSCKNMLIEYCDFNTGDDCIAIKAGRDQDGLRVGKPTENIVVRHCRGFRGHGGIVIGSETSGDVRNIYAFDCEFHGTDRIVRIKTARGRGGILENMWFRHLSADTIEQEALHLNMLYTGGRYPTQPVTRSTPRLRNIHYADISCAYAKRYAIEMLGLPEMPIENITMDSIAVHGSRGIACTDVRSVYLGNLHVTSDAWPVVKLTDAEGVTLNAMTVEANADPWLEVEGVRSSDIKVTHSDAKSAKVTLRMAKDVPAGVVAIQE